jgi:hypothetical protein
LPNCRLWSGSIPRSCRAPPSDNNAATPRVRALAADLQRVYDDPALLARVTKQVKLNDVRQISLFAEFYNMLNRANFGNSFGGNAFAPTTYNQPTG